MFSSSPLIPSFTVFHPQSILAETLVWSPKKQNVTMQQRIYLRAAEVPNIQNIQNYYKTQWNRKINLNSFSVNVRKKKKRKKDFDYITFRHSCRTHCCIITCFSEIIYNWHSGKFFCNFLFTFIFTCTFLFTCHITHFSYSFIFKVYAC